MLDYAAMPDHVRCWVMCQHTLPGQYNCVAKGTCLRRSLDLGPLKRRHAGGKDCCRSFRQACGSQDASTGSQDCQHLLSLSLLIIAELRLQLRHQTSSCGRLQRLKILMLCILRKRGREAAEIEGHIDSSSRQRLGFGCPSQLFHLIVKQPPTGFTVDRFEDCGTRDPHSRRESSKGGEKS